MQEQYINPGSVAAENEPEPGMSVLVAGLARYAIDAAHPEISVTLTPEIETTLADRIAAARVVWSDLLADWAEHSFECPTRCIDEGGHRTVCAVGQEFYRRAEAAAAFYRESMYRASRSPIVAPGAGS